MDSDLRAARLNQQLVANLVSSGRVRSQQVGQAFRTVPRHLFLPGVPLERAYEDDAVVTRERDGRPVSSASQPSIVAEMLEMLLLHQGMRVLEVGTGTGYNAALLARIAGAANVVTIDRDAELVAEARARLEILELGDVRAVSGDATQLPAELGRFDRIELTAGAWDIVPAWFEALKDGGIIVLPLSFGGTQICASFLRVGGRIVSQLVSRCGFMTIEGAEAGPGIFEEDPANAGRRARHEWPESLGGGRVWKLLAAATEPVPRAQFGPEGDASAVALALAGWRFVHIFGDSTFGTLCVAPSLDGAVVRWGDGEAAATPGAADRLFADMPAARVARDPCAPEDLQIEGEPIEPPRDGEEQVREHGPQRYEVAKRYFRYRVTAGGG